MKKMIGNCSGCSAVGGHCCCGLGFDGCDTIGNLMKDMGNVPHEPGIYVVRRFDESEPTFLPAGTHIKGEGPNVSIQELESNWVHGEQVVYIGKAGKRDGKATLHSRIRQYMAFGKGLGAAHRGGRYIWQLQDVKDLVVCWKTIDASNIEPRDVERQLIALFKSEHDNRRPFANLAD